MMNRAKMACQSMFLCFVLVFVLTTGCEPPQVVNEPAAKLGVQVNILDTDPSPSDGKVPITIQFSLNGKVVQLSDDAEVRCESTPMLYRGFLGYSARVPLGAAGSTYTCTHTFGTTVSTVSVPVPTRPSFTSLTEGAPVERSKTLQIQYQTNNAASVRVTATDGTDTVGGDDQSDNGTYKIDTSTLKAGEGSISLSKDIQSEPSGTGFASAKINYTITSVLKVTWK